MLLSEVNNVRQLVELLSDDGFTEAIAQAEDLVNDVNDTLDRVEEVEDEAAEAVKEANQTLVAVDRRLSKVDETISLLEAKIEAGFSLGFLVFAFNFFIDGDLLFAASLAFLGLLGAGQLLVTVRTIPQVQKLRELLRYVLERLGFRRAAALVAPNEDVDLVDDSFQNALQDAEEPHPNATARQRRSQQGGRTRRE
ncbi:hypothetical protein [Haloglomus salinum]|jgi:hypothetical protein|uniref:hypothetical protein n=1 Tax=Haloglomus salinum TaxID=2962673 RepID=UPI0020C9493C|nr:hypothetical protein [Haloglomus salinum]